MLSSHVKNANKTQLSIAFKWVKSKSRELVPESGEQFVTKSTKWDSRNRKLLN